VVDTLQCSHTSKVGRKAFALSYLDPLRGNYENWDDALKITHRFYNHRYCDPGEGNSAIFKTQNMCNFYAESGYSPNWAYNACVAEQGRALFRYDGTQDVCGLTPEIYNCNYMVDYLLNSPGELRAPISKQELINTLSDIGCNVSTDSTGRTRSNCSFTTPDSISDWVLRTQSELYPIVTAWGNQNIFMRKDITFQQVCVVAPNGTDPSWRPFCCSILSQDKVLRVYGADLLPQNNPLTVNNPLFTAPRSLTGFECDTEWCATDPQGYCLQDWLDNCQGASSCNRHKYLSRYNPQEMKRTTPTEINASNIMNNLSVSDFIAGIGQDTEDYTQGIPFGGWSCNDFYLTTKMIAQNLNKFFSFERNAAISRVQRVQQEVSQYCFDPATGGTGECACLRGYQSLNANFFAPNPDATSITFFSAPTPLADLSRRIDMYCDVARTGNFSSNGGISPETRDNSSFIGYLSYTTDSGSSYITYSNACQSLTSEGQYPPLGDLKPVQYPTLNPMSSILTQYNFADAIRTLPNNQSAMPYRCWLPACTNPSTAEAVFSDLLTSTITCPSVCYAYSGATNITVGDIDANVLSMGNFMQQCDFEGNEPKQFLSPFMLPGNTVRGFQFDVPQGYYSTLIIQIQNPELDPSKFAVSKTIYATSELPQLLSVSPNSSTLYKYSLSQFAEFTGVQDSMNLSVTIDARNQNVKYMQTNIWLSDNLRGVQRIPVTINIRSSLSDGTNESNWPQACYFSKDEIAPNVFQYTCNAVDCAFGSNSVLSYGAGCGGGGVSLRGTVLEGDDYLTYFRAHLKSNTNIRDTGFLSAHSNTPMVVTVQERQDRAASVLSRENVAAQGFAQLLQAHTQLYGKPFSLESTSVNQSPFRLA